MAEAAVGFALRRLCDRDQITMAIHSAVRDLLERRRLTLIAGPCVAESYDLCRQVAETLAEWTQLHGLGFIFKASFDKANRTSADSPRGPGIEAGLDMLSRLRSDLGIPVLTDIHHPEQAAPAACVVDVLQIPAFLCRQTDLIDAAAHTGTPTNIKKGQFLAPEEMKHVAQKFRAFGGRDLMVTERGTSFGYGQLVVDMRGLAVMGQAAEAPVIFDATHAVQSPGTGNTTTGGNREQAPLLARAAVAVGVAGLFCEVHPDPDRALSDGPNSLNFDLAHQVITQAAALDQLRREFDAR